MTISSVLLQTLCPALLPPPSASSSEADAEDDEYYAILGLPKYASAAEIRAAYKKKSLQLHPDKVQQRQQD